MRAITQTILLLGRIAAMPRAEVQAEFPPTTYAPTSAAPVAAAVAAPPAPVQTDVQPAITPADPQFLMLAAAVRNAGIGPASVWLYENLDALQLASFIKRFNPNSAS